MDFTRLETTGLNLDEVPNNGKAIAVVSGPADTAKITDAGFTYTTLIPNLARAEKGYRAREQANRVKCASNLRQVGLSYHMYANENKGKMRVRFTPRNSAVVPEAGRTSMGPLKLRTESSARAGSAPRQVQMESVRPTSV